METKPGFLADRLGFHPKGLSETPLYKEKLLAHAEVGRLATLTGVLNPRIDELRDGATGPAIVSAMLKLIVLCIPSKIEQRLGGSSRVYSFPCRDHAERCNERSSLTKTSTADADQIDGFSGSGAQVDSRGAITKCGYINLNLGITTVD